MKDKNQIDSAEYISLEEAKRIREEKKAEKARLKEQKKSGKDTKEETEAPMFERGLARKEA